MRKTILLMIAAVVFMASCTEEKNPPIAGFSLSADTAIQWDIVTVTDDATGATDVTYTVTGGEYEMDDAALTIQFLDREGVLKNNRSNILVNIFLRIKD